MTPLLAGCGAAVLGAIGATIGFATGHACGQAEIEFWRTRAHQHFRRLRAMRSDGREIDLFDERRRRSAGGSEETPPG